MTSILVIDDDDTNCRMFRIILEKGGYAISTASNGLEGLKILQGTSVDLVITDIIMPVMEGIETIMKIRKNHPGTKIIAMTGHGRLGHIGLDIADKLGVDMALEKPFSKSLLLQVVKTVLSKKQD